MDKTGYRYIPPALSHWITFLTGALPLRAVPTFIELLCGCLVSPSGFVCQAWAVLDMRRQWGSYYKWLQTGKWSWLMLGVRMAQLVAAVYAGQERYLVIDDTHVLRASKKAPGSRIHHQHGNKPNLAPYVRGQCWVSLAAVVPGKNGFAAIPLLARLMRATGNHSKLVAAEALLRVVRKSFATSCVLMDSWYMRGRLLKQLLGMDYSVIGQVRKDTALYRLPLPHKGRGRPRRYGEKLIPEAVLAMPEQRCRLHLYGKAQWVRLRSEILLARFLKGREVRAVWTQFEDEQGKPSRMRLIISTDVGMSAVAIVEAYAKRWAIEPMFNQLKNGWGIKEAWQQTRQVLARWVQLRQVAFGLTQLLALTQDVQGIPHLTPWRAAQPMTAGRIRMGLTKSLLRFDVRACWNPKSRKFDFEKPLRPPPKAEKRPNTA